MSPDTRRKKQKKTKEILRKIKLFSKTVLTVLFLGILISFGRALIPHGMVPDILERILPGILAAENPAELVVTAYDGISEYSSDIISSRQDQAKSISVAETAGGSDPADASGKFYKISDASISESGQGGAFSGTVKKTGGPLQLLDEAEVDRRLADLAAHDSDIAEIYAQKELYPKDLLAALASNQEMTEFVKGYLTASGTATGGISKEEKDQPFPLFIQWDQRWGYVPYGSGTISITGCGPTCMSMVIFSLTRDENATPDALAALSMEKDYYMKGAGTTWQFMTDAASWYGLSARELSLDEAVIRQYLDQGCPIVCAMRPGDFTATGHFIVIYDCDENGFRVNDPNSRERSGRYWSFDTLKGQIRNLWGYSRT